MWFIRVHRHIFPRRHTPQVRWHVKLNPHHSSPAMVDGISVYKVGRYAASTGEFPVPTSIEGDLSSGAYRRSLRKGGFYIRLRAGIFEFIFYQVQIRSICFSLSSPNPLSASCVGLWVTSVDFPPSIPPREVMNNSHLNIAASTRNILIMWFLGWRLYIA